MEVRGLHEDAFVMTRLLNNRCSRSINVVGLKVVVELTGMCWR